MRVRYLLVLAILAVPRLALAQIDCDAPAPTTPGQITTGRPFTVSFCVPSTVTITNADGSQDVVPVRIDGFTGQIDTGTSFEMGKLTLGAPSSILKLAPVTYRTSTGVPKGNHTITVTPWNYPLMADGVTPDTTKPKQNASPVSIPFAAIDLALTVAPPPIQKGRVTR